MRSERRVVFVLDLLQDVNILRPLMFLAAVDLKAPVEVIISGRFAERDSSGIWHQELIEITKSVGATLLSFDSEYAAFCLLQGKSGVIISASETDISAHSINHGVFKIAPSDFLRVTVQHGYECIGFLQNREHDKAHGVNIGFAADVICTWCELPALISMPAAQRDKVYVAGPPSLMQITAPTPPKPGSRPGLICENLHSVRLSASGDFKSSFMDIFFKFCGELETIGQSVTLRPHPAGQYFQKNKILAPRNVSFENAPTYKMSFGNYGFGISAPSSVVIDMLIAGIPTAIWQDEGGIMDAGNYEGLRVVRGLADWLAFREEAIERPQGLLKIQRDFLSRIRMPLEPSDVRQRYLRLLRSALGANKVNSSSGQTRRVLFVSNAFIPTLQLSFVKPLAAMQKAGQISIEFVDEAELKERFGAKVRSAEACDALIERFDSFAPDLVVFCRYSGPHAEALLKHARQCRVPTIFHIDDDLLNIPKEIGEAKWRMHNHPSRLSTVRSLLEGTDLVYASTNELRLRLLQYGVKAPVRSGAIYCSGSVLNLAQEKLVTRVGYMGFDHAHDLETVLPALMRYLERNTDVTFELFGSIPKPKELDRFGDRIRCIPPIRDYNEFLAFFAGLDWDIGICPLAITPFNMVKANTKWVEYSSIGAAVVATRGTVYDECTDGGCGMLASSEEEWVGALEELTRDPALRYRQVVRAQEKVHQSYSEAVLRDQVLSMFALSRELAETTG